MLRLLFFKTEEKGTGTYCLTHIIIGYRLRIRSITGRIKNSTNTERRWKLGGYETGKVRGLEFGVGNAEFGKVGENVNKARRPGCYEAGKM